MSSVFRQKTDEGPPPFPYHFSWYRCNLCSLLCSGCWNTKRWSPQQNDSHVTRDANMKSRRVHCCMLTDRTVLCTWHCSPWQPYLWVRTHCWQLIVLLSPRSRNMQVWNCPQHCSWALWSAGMWHRVVCWVMPDVSLSRGPESRTILS
jgi:hypothetical protein